MDLNDMNRLNGNDYCEGDEEDLFRNGSSVAVDYFDLIVGQLEDILIDENFQKIQRDFLDKYCLEFDDTEENKLSYMEIFDEYVSTIERNIEQRLKLSSPDFSMERFQNELETEDGTVIPKPVSNIPTTKAGSSFFYPNLNNTLDYVLRILKNLELGFHFVEYCNSKPQTMCLVTS